MGLLNLFRHNMIKEVTVLKDVDLLNLEKLEELVDKVGDDQKEIVETQLKKEKAGVDGEKRVMYEIKHLKEPCLVIHDLTLFDKSADSAQIDFVILTKNCGIVLESKSLQGNITINSDGEFTRQFVNNERKVYRKEGMYSPIRQNEIHVGVIEDYIDKYCKNLSYYPIESLVVISNDRTIIDKKYATKNVKDAIVKFDQLDNNIYKLIQKHSDIDVSDSKLYDLANMLIDNDVPRIVDYVSSLKLKLIDEELFEETMKAQETGFVEEDNSQVIDNTLMDNLKKYRLKKAKELNYQPYFIFNNAQMEQIINISPKTKEELCSIDGFGDKKFEMYGNDIIAIVGGKSLEDLEAKEEPKPSNNDSSDLESALKQYRLNKSRELGYKPYFIYNNEEMNNIIDAKPTTKEEFLKIAGFGEKKYEMYGEDIISIIRKYL